MKNEVKFKNRKKTKLISYHLYEKIDPITKILVRIRSYFKLNPFQYFLLKFFFGFITIIIPLIFVCNNLNMFFKNEESLINKNSENNIYQLNNLTDKKILIKNNYFKKLNKSVGNLTFNFLNNSNSTNNIINDKFFVEKYEKNFLIKNKTEELDFGFETNKRIDFLLPLKISFSVIILLLLSYFLYKLCDLIFITK